MDTTPSRGSRTLSAQDAARNARKAAAASWAGTALEQFDFSIYVAASALVFSKVFFPAAGPQLGTALSLATLGIGYVIRPIAAAAIGHAGDRWSRKKMLVFTVTTMGAATFLIGCLPTAAAIGVWAPVLLVVLRVVQGVSAAGESIGSVTMALEHSPTHRRGFYGSWTNTGAVTGIMLGSLAFVLVRRLPPEQMMSWGWRVPFWCGILVTVVGLLIRRTLPESQEFLDTKALQVLSERQKLPIVQVFSEHWASVGIVILLMLASVVSSIGSSFTLSYAGMTQSMNPSVILWMTVLTAFLSIFTQPLFGLASDHLGRRPVFVAGTLVCAGGVFGVFHSIETSSTLAVFLWGILTMSIEYGMINPLIPPMTAELFPTEIRYSGGAISSQLGLVPTGFAPSIAAAVSTPARHGWLPVCIMVAACCLVSAATAAVLYRETSQTSTRQLGTD